MPGRAEREFDCQALFQALEEQRQERGLSWRGVADEFWAMSSELNAIINDHPFSPSTITNMAKRNAISCQHALFMLHWLGRTPESFVTVSKDTVLDVPLPLVGTNRRLRWKLKALYEGLNEQRQANTQTWIEVANELRCTPSQLTGLRTAKFATNMAGAMRITLWLQRPSADFIYAAKW